MKITVNGAPREIEASDLAEALVKLGYGPEARVATALNEEFVPAGQRSGRRLEPGDRVEVLAPMQGG